ncbi:MAG: histidine phosphotransferase family protein [Pseudomonadota bacterium]
MSNRTAGHPLEVLIASRICHDLISPIGAISNGVELMQAMQTGGQSPELALLAESAELAAAKLEFFRLAFGQAGLAGDTVCPKIGRVLRDQFTKPRLIFDLSLSTDAVLRRDAKLLALMALCAERALPKGGTLSLTLTDETVMADVVGPVVRTDTPPWELLRSGTEPEELTAADVQFRVLREFATSLDLDLSLATSDSRATLTTRPTAFVRVA